MSIRLLECLGGRNKARLIALATLAVLLFAANSLRLTSSAGGPNALVTAEAATPDTIYVDGWVGLPQSYGLFDYNVGHSITVNISASFSSVLLNATSISCYMYMNPNEIRAKATYSDGNESEVMPVIVPMGYGKVVVIYFYFSGGLRAFRIYLRGQVDGLSLLWRNMVEVNAFTTQFSNPMPTAYRMRIEAPNAVEVTSIDSTEGYSLQIGGTPNAAGKIYSVNFPTGLVIYYRPDYWLALATFLTVLLVVCVAFAPWYAGRINSMIPRNVGARVVGMGNLIRLRLSSDKFLASFVLCSLLMVSLSLIGGPDPRVKIYAVATPYAASVLKTTLESSLGPVQLIGPQDTITEFGTMQNLGVIGAIIISYYPEVALKRISTYVISSLDQIPLIIVDESLADPEIASAIEERYAGKTIIIRDLNELYSARVITELRGLRKENPLGIQNSMDSFKLLSILVAVLSFVEAFLALGFLSSKLIEASRTRGWAAIAEAIAIPALVFYLTQAIYMASSVLLAMPIGLHAVTSGSTEITVVGLLGFGGGSVPRTFAGLGGFFLGAFAAMRSNAEIDRFGLMAFVILLLVLAIDPFTGGRLFYDSLLFFLSGPKTEFMRTSILYTKDILGTMGRIFGGWASPTYGLSTGEIFFYSGATAIFLFPILKRSSGTFLLFTSAFIASSGFIRTAEMTPYHTVASLIPGVFIGLAFMIAFVVMSMAENYLRSKLAAQ